MAQPRLRAEFFATIDGAVAIKAKPINYTIRRKIYERDNGTCQLCGRLCFFGGNCVSPWDIKPSSAVDHIVPRSRGGQNEESNLRLLCQSCNAAKGAK